MNSIVSMKRNVLPGIFAITVIIVTLTLVVSYIAYPPPPSHAELHENKGGEMKLMILTRD